MQSRSASSQLSILSWGFRDKLLSTAPPPVILLHLPTTAIMLDYDYHYPLTPIQSASDNIHPAFRESLVPPPRNPLRSAIKPLFSVSTKEANSSTPSLAKSLPDDQSTDFLAETVAENVVEKNTPTFAPPAYRISNDSTLALNAPEPVTPETSMALVSPLLPSYSLTSTPRVSMVGAFSVLASYKEVDNRSSVALNAPEPVSSLSSLHSSPTSQSPPTTILTARTLSSLPCPSSLLPQEWSFFLKDLRQAAALSKSQKALSLAVALAAPVCCPVSKGLVLWGVWRYQTVKNVRMGLENGDSYEKKRGREGVEGVVERWNKRWEERGVKVGLEVRTKGRNGKGEKGRLRVVVSEFEAKKVLLEDGYESEDDFTDLEKDLEKASWADKPTMTRNGVPLRAGVMKMGGKVPFPWSY